MTYTAPGAMEYALNRGNCDEKLTTELGKIANELTAIEGQQAGGVFTAEVTLGHGNANAFIMAWPNPTAGAILITRLIVNITTPGGTATAVADFGTAANATTHSDNLIDGADANAAAMIDNITGPGTDGKASQILAAGAYITGQILVANAAALAGKAYIQYSPVS